MFCFPQVSEHSRAEPWKPRAEPEHAPEKAFEKNRGSRNVQKAESPGVILRMLKDQIKLFQLFFFSRHLRFVVPWADLLCVARHEIMRSTNGRVFSIRSVFA